MSRILSNFAMCGEYTDCVTVQSSGAIVGASAPKVNILQNVVVRAAKSTRPSILRALLSRESMGQSTQVAEEGCHPIALPLPPIRDDSSANDYKDFPETLEWLVERTLSPSNISTKPLNLAEIFDNITPTQDIVKMMNVVHMHHLK
ncbi:uncharacterized protein LOC116162989 [Photinus pyralis]|nr:uncharacterized protein LOC116162989 [Photinus pyralis]